MNSIYLVVTEYKLFLADSGYSEVEIQKDTKQRTK